MRGKNKCGTPGEIYGTPQQLSVARFVGSVSVNEIPVSIEDEALYAGQIRLGLRARGAPNGRFVLAVRAEALEAVPGTIDRTYLQLPVEHLEYSGSEVFVRCNGKTIGTDWIRVQMPAERFEQLRASGDLGGTIALQVRPHGGHLFALSGARMPVALENWQETNELRHAVSV